MKRNLFTLVALLLALHGAPASAQQKAVEAEKSAVAMMPLEEVRVGQKGTGRTVFAGSEMQEFGVEVLGVMPGFPQPRMSVIIARLSGANVERTSVFAGMSGSPVYIDGKLVGAVAYAFPFSKEPIAGITPIKQMIDIFERGVRQSDGGRDTLGFHREPRAVSYSQLAGTDWKAELAARGRRRDAVRRAGLDGVAAHAAARPAARAHLDAGRLQRLHGGRARALRAAASVATGCCPSPAWAALRPSRRWAR